MKEQHSQRCREVEKPHFCAVDPFFSLVHFLHLFIFTICHIAFHYTQAVYVINTVSYQYVQTILK